MRKFEVYYQPVSIVEAKFVVLKLLRSGVDVLEDYRRGLECLLSEESMRPTPLTSSEVEELSDELLKLGLRDYFDRMLYSTSSTLGLDLVTEDREIVNFSSKLSRRPPRILSWNDVRKYLD